MTDHSAQIQRLPMTLATRERMQPQLTRHARDRADGFSRIFCRLAVASAGLLLVVMILRCAAAYLGVSARG